jgi:hypothetical protein
MIPRRGGTGSDTDFAGSTRKLKGRSRCSPFLQHIFKRIRKGERGKKGGYFWKLNMTLWWLQIFLITHGFFKLFLKASSSAEFFIFTFTGIFHKLFGEEESFALFLRVKCRHNIIFE